MVDTENLILQNQYLTEEVQRQTKEVQRRIDHLAALNIVAATVSQSLDLDKTLKTALETVTNVVSAEAGGISLIDEDHDELVLRAQLGWIHDFTSPPMRIPLGKKGMSEQVIRSDGVLLYNDLDGSEEYAVESFTREEFRSIAMAPMHARGKIIGILSIMSYRPNSFDDDAITLLRSVADTVGVALDNAQLYKASVENESRLSAVLYSTADGIIALNSQHQIQLLNPSAENMLSIRNEKVLGTTLEDMPLPEELLRQLAFTIESSETAPEKSFQYKMPNGRILLAFVSPVREENRERGMLPMDGWVIVFQDVTHLREAEEMRAQFIQAAAHDMRNPLGVTITSLGTLKSMMPADDELANEVLDLALTGVNRLQHLIDDLLHLERLESGYQFQIDDVDIAGLIHEVSAEVRPLIEKKQHNYEISIGDGVKSVPCDAHWISRAITNYIGNAIKYTPACGNIGIRCYQRNKQIHIEVTDDGPGIPIDMQPRLFERFYRANEKSAERGSGLGLAIVKSVVETHGGTVYVRSRVGEGSTFGITLPNN